MSVSNSADTSLTDNISGTLALTTSKWEVWKYAALEDSVSGSLSVIGGDFKAPYQMSPEPIQEQLTLITSVNHPVVRYEMIPQDDVTAAIGILNGELA